MPTATKRKSTKRTATKPKARTTKPEKNPGKESYQSELAQAWYSLGHWEQYQEQTLNEHTALTYSAVWACVRLISQTVACLGWKVFAANKDGKEEENVNENDIAWLLDMEASPEMSALEFRQILIHDALLGGNGYAEIERNNNGSPRWMYRLSPERVNIQRTIDGQLIYRITNNGFQDSYLWPWEVFHLRGMGSDGVVGYSVIEMAKRTLKLGMDQERFGSSFFSKGPMPGGILKLPGNVKKEERDEARRASKAYGGAKNAGNVITVSGGMEFTPLTLPNSDAQFLESRRFSVEEICRIFGVPPHKIADLTRSTNNNIEHQAIEWVQDCLLPWCRRLETEANIKLFGRNNKGRYFTTLNLNTLLRGDSNTQTDTVTKKVTSGLLTVNEGRRYFDMNPIEGGDTPLVQGAMVRLDTVIDPPEPPPKQPTQMPTEEPAPAEDSSVEAKWQSAVEIIADTIGKLLRVEADKSERAAKSGGWKAWADRFYPLHEDYTSTHLRESFAAAIAVIGANVSESRLNAAADCAAQRHVARSLRELSCGPLAGGNWRMRATYQAKEELRYLAEEKLP